MVQRPHCCGKFSTPVEVLVIVDSLRLWLRIVGPYKPAAATSKPDPRLPPGGGLPLKFGGSVDVCVCVGPGTWQ